MEDHDWLAERFEENRTHVRSVANRILGSLSEAEDAVQEAWLRVSRADSSDVADLGGWLTTVVARVSLNMLQTRRSRREEPDGGQVVFEIAGRADGPRPEEEAVLADSIGPALLVILDTSLPRNGRFDALLALLDPAVVLRADDVTVQMGAAAAVLGAPVVAEILRTSAGCTAGARRRGGRSDVGCGWPASRRVRVHDHRRKDRRHRHDCRPDDPARTRSGSPH